MLLNKSTGQPIIDRVKTAEGLWAQFQGLMFERPSKFDYALVFPLPFESRVGASVHMLFVFFPLDLVFLDKGRRVIDKKEDFKAWAKTLVSTGKGLVPDVKNHKK